MTRGKYSLRYGRLFAGVLGATVALAMIATSAQAQRVVPLTSEMSDEMMADLAAAPAAEIISVALNKAQIITLSEPIRDVIVASPDIADVIVKTPRQVYVVSRGTGQTNMFFVGLNGNVVRHVVVHVMADLEAAHKALNELLPGSNITLHSVNRNVVMSGTVRSAAESVNALSLVSRFVEFEGDDGEDSVINMLRVTEDQQVLLQVRVGEISRNTLKTLGFDTDFTKTFQSGSKGLIGEVLGAGAVAESIASGTFLINEFGLGTADFEALERQGLVKTLAEPVLTAISGETATFLAGGEFPTPSGIDRNGNLSFEFKPFGVSLGFTPVVLSGGQISLRVGVEVSATTSENSITVGQGGSQTEIPGLNVRRTESTVTVPSGGTLMIAGMVQNDELNSISGLPGAMSLPIIGALFRSQRYQSRQTELVVLVTAHRVKSMGPQQMAALPTDGFVTASEADIYLYGRLHKRYNGQGSIGDLPSIYGPFGYIME